MKQQKFIWRLDLKYDQNNNFAGSIISLDIQTISKMRQYLSLLLYEHIISFFSFYLIYKLSLHVDKSTEGWVR